MKGLSGAETLLRVLRAMGVERIFASPGSDWAPLWEALAKLHWPDVPEYLSTRHEETAVGMATGYAKATGKLPAVVLHTTVGALHATMGVRAALHERIPMVVLAGESIGFAEGTHRSEEHTSELQSRLHLVCRLLLEKKKNTQPQRMHNS